MPTGVNVLFHNEVNKFLALVGVCITNMGDVMKGIYSSKTEVVQSCLIVVRFSQREDIIQLRTSVRRWSTLTSIQRLPLPKCKIVNLSVYSKNLRTLEVARENCSVRMQVSGNICCLQGTRFIGNSLKMNTGKGGKVFYGKERSGKVYKRHKSII